MVTDKALTAEFERIRPQLKSFILRMTASVEDSEDIVQDTFIKTFRSIESFKGDSSLKTWIFAVATNLCKDFLRSKKLWPENVTDLSKDAAMGSPTFMKQMMEIRASSLQGDFEIKDHINHCFTCIAKTLPIEQQLALLLKEVYEFKVVEIMAIIGVTEGVVKHLLFNSRQKMIDIFDKRCSLISKEGFCHQCSELNGYFNPKHELQKDLMKIEMVKAAESNDKDHLFDLRMTVVKNINPFDSSGSELQLQHLKWSKTVMDTHLKNN
jgi:RNA polymerase sigma-70 factor, ECF subfamily